MPSPADEAVEALEREVAEAIAANVRYMRLKKGLTQKQLADDLEVGPATIRELEGARYRPGTRMLCRLAVVFGVHPRDLLVEREMDEARKPGRPTS